MENFSLFSGQKSESVENTNSLFLCQELFLPKLKKIKSPKKKELILEFPFTF
jgi:hypothetical protein